MGISDDDRNAFAEATRDVRRLQPDRRVGTERARPRAIARHTRAATDDMLAESIADTGRAVMGEEIAFCRRGVSDRVFKALRRGQYSIEDEIDLHGLRRDAARIALRSFINECMQRRLGCVRIVHGKGARSGPDGPVLKASVQHWLAQWDPVLAFVSAQPRHGGSGAVYVLLRNG